MPGPLSLLDRFVRLAAHGCQVACAYVEAGRDRAWFGPLSAAAWTALCSAEGDGGGFAVMARVPLLSQAGRSLGTLLVADRMGRDQLTTTQMTALDDVAALLVAALEQEHRHEHLVELTDRAARVDGILRQVSEAESCEDALTKVLKGLCGHHDAAVGRIWRLSTVDGLMQEISRFADDPVDDQSYYRQPPTAPVRAGNSMTAGSIRDNVPQTVIYSRVADPTKFVLMNAAISSGLRSQVSFPIWVEEQRFGISLAFTTEREDLDDIVADIAALANTIRPALFRKVSEERIRFMAHHDDLTQLGNRAVFNEGLAEAVRVASMGGTGLALLYLDLDGFKVVNDMRGHEVGDKLLAAVAGRLRSSSREGDTVTRIGGDEFAIIHPAASQPYAATQLARRLLTAIGEPFEIDGQPVMIGVSIGIALHPTDGETPDVLQRNADAALYEAKQGGRNTVRLFDRSVAVMQQERQLIERDLKDAIEREEFTLAFQPIVASDSLRVRGLEALLRWTHPTRGSLSPGRFVPLAEQSGLIIPLGRWALHAACMEAARWRRGTCLSVNFSPLQFRQPGLALQIETVLSRTGLPPSNLDMEVTEGVLLDDSGLVMKTMHELREMGVKMTLDDFGTAYASLGYLRRFPFDRIKIDQSFIQGMCNDDATLAIVQAILSLGARLNLQVVAEGVETEQELATLRTLGCELVQGFLTGRPVPQAQLGTLAGFRPGQSRPA